MTIPKPDTGALSQLLDLMRRLRSPEGCPWDREQSFATIAPYTIEEAYEVADAIERKDRAALREELGDLLFQVVFHAQMAEEENAFSFADVVDALVVKMKRRHPHVFAEAQILSAAEQTEAWEKTKAAERSAKAAEASVLDGLPLALPALLRAAKLQKRMSRVGFDWPDRAGALAKLEEELEELRKELEAPQVSHERLADELGDVLFACVNLGRFLDADPEAALRRANVKVERRFRAVEAALKARGTTPEEAGLAEMDRLWDQVKKEERDL